MLPACHVLQHPLDDEISVKAWTNLIVNYDYDHTVFLQSDLDRFAAMSNRIDDAIRAGDVSFAYDVYRTYATRLAARIAYATNLLEHGTFDFTKDEDYLWQRKDAPWPKTVAEQDELWRKRIKNEMLTQILARELDAEDASNEAARVSATNTATRAHAAAATATNRAEEAAEIALTPAQNLVKRYRQYLAILAEPDEETVLQRYLSAVANAYDPHTDYMSPVRKEDFDMEMNLSLCGVGALLQADDGALKISEVMPGGPMDKDKRIKKGDRIVGVGQGDGPVEDILYQPMNKSIRKIRGKKGTRVVLEIVPRSDPLGATRKRVALVRDEIKLEDQAATGRVETVVLDGVTNLLGYVRLPAFYGTMDKQPGDPGFRSATLDVAREIARFNARGVTGMILDLRGDGGGSLREAVQLSALFVRSGPVVQVREADRLYVLPIPSPDGGLACRRPLVVLIDRASASASEIVAGLLQDSGRAVVVGDTQSHGKGTVQTVLPIGDDKYGSMKITTARFYRINGSSTQVRGVGSDIVIPSVLDELDIGEDKLPNALPWSRIEPAPYALAWNMPDYVVPLRAGSAERLAVNPRYTRHVRAVHAMRAASRRVSVPLARAVRLALMRQERALRDLEDVDDADDGLDAALPAPSASAVKPPDDGDAVLSEAFNILADLVRKTGGVEVPPVSDDSSNRGWMRFFGGTL